MAVKEKVKIRRGGAFKYVTTTVNLEDAAPDEVQKSIKELSKVANDGVGAIVAK